MRLALFIAKRYLFAKKSHNVINIISAISAIGMAIGTAALIIILSVYNGFDSLIRSMMSNVEPELLISPSQGKVFVAEGEAYDWLYSHPSVESMCTILEENVFITYEDKQEVARVRGVDSIYEEESPLASKIVDGHFALHRGDVPMAIIGSGLAYKMDIRPHFVAPLDIYFPSRTSKFSPLNPSAAIESIRVFPSGIFSVNTEIDKSLILIPIEKMRELLDYENEISAVEIRLVASHSEKELKQIKKELQLKLGEGFLVKDRYEQNESLYKMMKYEKVSIYLILILIIIVIAFNIFGSLSMLLIEKEDDIKTLKALGAEQGLIKKIFVYEGWLISLLGLVMGLILGIGFVLLQQQFGLIKMPEGFLLQAYPVILSFSDIILTSLGVAVIGYIIALIPVKTF